MKRLALCLIVGMICLGVGSIVLGQQDSGGVKPKPDSLPADACKAIEQYVAKINAAGSVKDKAKREVQYSQAQDGLTTALKNLGRPEVIEHAMGYSQYTEQIVVTDPLDKGYGDLVEKRIKLSELLLNLCMSYTTAR
jgi:hypothetical protein